MKKNILYFLLFMNIAFAQKKIHVYDKNNKGVSNVNVFIDGVYNTSTNNEGEFILDNNSVYSTIRFTHIAFDDLILKRKQITPKIILTSKVQVLNEIIILKQAKKETIVLFPRLKPLEWFKGFNHFRAGCNMQMALLVRNNNTKPFVVTKIFVDLRKKYKGSPESAFLPVYCNLMKYDTINQVPGDFIFDTNFTIKKSKNQDYAEIKLEKPVAFPKEGLVVFVQMLDESFYENYKIDGYIQLPTIAIKTHEDSSKFKSFFKTYNYANKVHSKWRGNEFYKTDSYFCFGIEIEEERQFP
jgi:hypothetical protein